MEKPINLFLLNPLNPLKLAFNNSGNDIAPNPLYPFKSRLNNPILTAASAPIEKLFSPTMTLTPNGLENTEPEDDSLVFLQSEQ